MITNQLKTDYSQQKFYDDHRWRDLKFEKDYKVYQKISPMKWELRFGNKRKLSPSYLGPYEILQKAGKVDHRVEIT